MEKLGRRQFLKLAGAATGVSLAARAVVGITEAGAEAPESVSRTSARSRQSIASTCQLCQARCGIVCFVEDDKVIKIEGNPLHPNNRGKLCAKGQAGLNLAYNPDRLLYPMRRVGKRGDGGWERISWDEAINEISSRLGEIKASGNLGSFVFQSGTLSAPRLVRRFVDATGTPNAFFSIPNTDTNRILALNSMLGTEQEISDLANARYILNFGANPYEAYFYHLPAVQRLMKARTENRAKLVTFDVRVSNTAGKSDEWFAINPGSDGVVALAMANVIMKEGLHDADFINRWTNVSAADLAVHLAHYTPEMASEVSGVPAADIERLAREFANDKPSTTISGGGVSMRSNGLDTVRSIALLNVVTGNVDAKGGYCLPRSYSLKEIEPSPQKASETGGLLEFQRMPSHTVSHSVLPLIKERGKPVEMLMTYMFNPAYSNASTSEVVDTLKDERLVRYSVVVDIAMSETASLADLVLPDTTFLERWDIETGPALGLVPFVALRQPVMKSLGETRSFSDVCLELARRDPDLARYFKFSTEESYLKGLVSGVPGLAQSGGWDYLRANGVWYGDAPPAYRTYAGGGFGTPSGKIEIYSKDLADKGQSPLPVWNSVPEYELEADEGLHMVTFKWSVLTSSLATSKWLSEIVHDNPLWLNPETAAEMGIKKGDIVTVSSPVGEIKTRVRLTQGIHPRVVAMSGQVGHSAMGRVARAEKFVSPDADTRLVWWHEEGHGNSPNRVMAQITSPLTGAPGWHDNKVKVSRA